MSMFSGLSSARYRIGILAGLVAIVLLGVIAWEYTTRPDEAPAAPDNVSVTTLHSDVFIKEGAGEFQPVEGTATTTGGSTIRTSDTGRALIESAAAHRTLIDYSSEIVLNESADTHTHVGLLSGAVWSRLAKVFDSGEYYEIKTGNAVAAVRGTSFGMWYSSGVTTLIVLEGTVAFSAIDPATGLAIPGTEVLVTAGQKALRDADGKIVVTSLTKEDYGLPWVLFNDSDESPGAAPAVPAAGTPDPQLGSPVDVPLPDGQTPVPAAPPPVAGPELSVVSPSKIDEGSDERITIRGSELLGVTVVEVGSKKVDFEVLRDTVITFYADDIRAGTYSVTVTGAGGKSDTLSRALTVEEVVPVQDQSQGYNQDPLKP